MNLEHKPQARQKNFIFYFLFLWILKKQNRKKKKKVYVHPPKPKPNIVLNVKSDTLKYMSWMKKEQNMNMQHENQVGKVR